MAKQRAFAAVKGPDLTKAEMRGLSIDREGGTWIALMSDDPPEFLSGMYPAAKDMGLRSMLNPGPNPPAESQPTRTVAYLRFAVVDGVTTCTAIQIVDPNGITPGYLRRMPWQPLINLSEVMMHTADGPLRGGYPRHLTQKRGRRGYDDDHYKAVAAAYLEASARSPRTPIQDLEHTLTVDTSKGSIPASRATIQRWIKEARRRGHLPTSNRQKRAA